VRPFGSRVRPPPLQHAPVRAHALPRTHPRPNTCPHPNGCARIAFRPREDIEFAPGPTRLRPLNCICARRMCAHSRRRAKSPHSVPRVHAWSPRPFLPVRARRVCAHIRGRAKSPRLVPRVRTSSPRWVPRVRASSPRPVPRVHASSSRPFPPVRARSHLPAPISTHSRPTRSRFYQRAHAADRAGDQCTLAVISRWRPLQPRAPLAVYKPVRAPS
jgi:hypothetical protein